MQAVTDFETTCPLCGKPMTVKDGMAMCNHYPPDEKVIIHGPEE